MHQIEIFDSRRSPREEVGEMVGLRVGDVQDGLEAELDNISTTGFLIWSDLVIDEGTRVVVILDADSPDELPVELVGLVVRITERDNLQRQYGYGCDIST